MVVLHQDHQFEKCLEGLRRSGGSGALAARRAQEILSELTSLPGRAAVSNCRLTKNGEARINKCRKYDLGGGYRLVLIRDGRHLIPLFAGSHDDCDRWLQRNQGFKADIPTPPTTLFPTPVREPETPPSPAAAAESDEYELSLKKRLTNRELKELFSGLWQR